MDQALNPTAINSYLSAIEALSGTNFKKWNEQIGIILGIMDLDYALREQAPTKPNDTSSNEQMALYEKWERSNRLSLMIMKGSIMPAIQGAIPISESAVNYMKSIEEQFIRTSKSLASTLMIKMMTMKYDGLSGINYNTQKDKWKMSELIAMCVQEEEKLKAENPDIAHLTTMGPTKKISRKAKGYLTSRKLNKGQRTITVGNGIEVDAEAIGILYLILDSGFILDLVNTVYVLVFTRNLISVSQLDSCDSTYAQSLLSFHLNDSVNKKRKRVNEKSSMLWHKRLGHISRERMEHPIKDGILSSLDFSDFSTCVNCIKGKYTKTKKKGVTRTTELLATIHIDICSPFTVPTIYRHKHFITFLDDFSKYTYVYLICEKPEALDIFNLYKAEVENQLDRQIKSVRSNRGGEYYGRFTVSGQNPSGFALFVAENDIIANYT
ncbi:uncharacterized protein LOC114267114 [Camellia sinensis]|uniref:uncharacterized protein LOC114267114 n=1 Tax=Camellia sinensis TaxID=4442 RepID=UPI001036503F|nr:uncharacterized protein LOC114267114 [Camellia sinensis]